MSSVWTLVAKPTETSVTTSVIVQATAAQPFGLLMAVTSVTASGIPTTSVTGSSVITGWGPVPKPTTYGWTSISKPTS